MTLLKHPTADTIVDVSDARAKVLLERGWTETDADPSDVARQASVGKPGAVQPQPPIDARPNPPEPPIEARPDEEIGEEPIDTRPENPLGPTAASVEEADGAGLDKGSDEQPAKSAKVAEWRTYAKAHGVEDADDLSKAKIQARLGA